MDRELDVDQLVDKHGMPSDLDIEFQRLLPDRVVATMPVDHRHLQPLGVLHGGVSVTLAESVATVGAWLNCPGQGGVRCHHQRRSPYAQAPRRPPHRRRHA